MIHYDPLSVPLPDEEQMPLLAEPLSADPDTCYGVIVTLPAEHCLTLYAQCQRWFATRSEVTWIDSSVSCKQELGYVLVEWEGCDVDPLFLDHLLENDDVLDYTLYERAGEEEDA